MQLTCHALTGALGQAQAPGGAADGLLWSLLFLWVLRAELLCKPCPLGHWATLQEARGWLLRLLHCFPLTFSHPWNVWPAGSDTVPPTSETTAAFPIREACALEGLLSGLPAGLASLLPACLPLLPLYSLTRPGVYPGHVPHQASTAGQGQCQVLTSDVVGIDLGPALAGDSCLAVSQPWHTPACGGTNCVLCRRAREAALPGLCLLRS